MTKVLYIYIIAVVFSATNVYSQVGGLSNSKVVLPGTATVEPGDFEFEPSFDVFWSNKAWDQDGNTLEFDKTTRVSGLAYRFTAGFEHNMEAGLTVPEDVSTLSFGFKWLFWKKNDKSFALQSGVRFESDNREISETEESLNVITNGVVFTYEPNDKFSFDTDVSFSLYSADIGSEPANYSGTFDIGAAYFLTNRFQTILELNSAWISFENSVLNSSKSNGTLGIKYNPNDGTAIIFGLKQGLFGTNNDKGVSFVGAFTFLMGR